MAAKAEDIVEIEGLVPVVHLGDGRKLYKGDKDIVDAAIAEQLVKAKQAKRV